MYKNIPVSHSTFVRFVGLCPLYSAIMHGLYLLDIFIVYTGYIKHLYIIHK